MTVNVQVVRVFSDEAGRYGNELGVVLDAAGYSAEDGIRLTARLGFSETVFVDAVDDAGADVRIFNPTAEMRLAGHPMVGASRVLEPVIGRRPVVLRPRLATPVETWREGEVTWIRADAGAVPEFAFTRLDSAEQVERMDVPEGEQGAHGQFWAWIDEAAGTIRARTFVGALGIPEDEATGGAALRQAQRLAREVTIRQGRGSVLHTRPAERAGWSEVGGRVVAEPERVVEL